jgi:hypothetical protein
MGTVAKSFTSYGISFHINKYRGLLCLPSLYSKKLSSRCPELQKKQSSMTSTGMRMRALPAQLLEKYNVAARHGNLKEGSLSL